MGVKCSHAPSLKAQVGVHVGSNPLFALQLHVAINFDASNSFIPRNVHKDITSHLLSFEIEVFVLMLNLCVKELYVK